MTTLNADGFEPVAMTLSDEDGYAATALIYPRGFICSFGYWNGESDACPYDVSHKHLRGDCRHYARSDMVHPEVTRIPLDHIGD